MKRTRLRRIGARKKREMEELVEFRREVLLRAGHQCECCGGRADLHAHHRLPKSRGGSNNPSNGACLCFRCHREAHDHIGSWRRWID